MNDIIEKILVVIAFTGIILGIILVVFTLSAFIMKSAIPADELPEWVRRFWESSSREMINNGRI